MKEFIELTQDLLSSDNVIIFTEHIQYVYKHRGSTLIKVGDTEFYVKESLSQIKSLIYPHQQSTGPR